MVLELPDLVNPPRHFFYLDVFRGLAALAVFAGHIRALFFQSFEESGDGGVLTRLFYLLTSYGHEAVMVFFVLSGCVITHSISNSVNKGCWAWTHYLMARLSRLWVVLLPALVLGVAWDCLGLHYFGGAAFYQGMSDAPVLGQAVGEQIDPVVALGNVFFLQTIFVPSLGSNSPLWSLANEFWYYLLFPLLLFSFRSGYRVPSRLLFPLAAGLICWMVGRPIASYFLIWLMGAGVYALYLRWPLTRSRLAVFGCLSGLALTAALLVFIRWREWPLLGVSNDYWLGACFAFTVYCSLHLDGSGWIRPARHLFRFLADISYTLYVVHMPLLVFLAAGFIGGYDQRMVIGAEGLLLFLGLVLVGLLYAWLCYRCFEAHTAKVRRFVLSKIGLSSA